MLDKCCNLVRLKTNDVQYNSGAVEGFLTESVNQWHLQDPDCVLSGSTDSLLERSCTHWATKTWILVVSTFFIPDKQGNDCNT